MEEHFRQIDPHGPGDAPLSEVAPRAANRAAKNVGKPRKNATVQADHADAKVDPLERAAELGLSLPDERSSFIAALALVEGALRDVSDEKQVAARKIASAVTRRASRVLLNWMGQGRTDELVEVERELAGVLYQPVTKHLLAWEHLSANRQFVFRLHVLLELLNVFRTTPNHARVMGQLLTARNRTRRQLLEYIAQLDRPVFMQDVRHLFNHDNTAYAALDALVEQGWLSDEMAGKRRMFALTWAGRGVVDTLRKDAIAGDQAAALAAPSAPSITPANFVADASALLSSDAEGTSVSSDPVAEVPPVLLTERLFGSSRARVRDAGLDDVGLQRELSKL